MQKNTQKNDKFYNKWQNSYFSPQIINLGACCNAK